LREEVRWSSSKNQRSCDGKQEESRNRKRRRERIYVGFGRVNWDEEQRKAALPFLERGQGEISLGGGGGGCKKKGGNWGFSKETDPPEGALYDQVAWGSEKRLYRGREGYLGIPKKKGVAWNRGWNAA